MDFEGLKDSYYQTVQFGIMINKGYTELKQANNSLCEFCKIIVDHSNYNDSDKERMKNELEKTKEIFAESLDALFKK